MTGAVLGLPLDEALAILRGEGIENVEVTMTESPKNAPDGAVRVVRISEDGRRISAARFPDRVTDEGKT